MNLLRVNLDAQVITKFKRRARATKKEVLGRLIGTQKGDEFFVTRISYPKTRSTASWVQEQKPHARPRNCIGTLHSHPNERFSFVTPDDIKGSVLDGDRVFGIFTWWACGEHLDFYSVDKLVMDVVER